jgi:hypothetical protein
MVFGMAQGVYRKSNSPIDVGAIIRDTCREVDMALTEAARVMVIDEATWSRALRGDAPLDLWHIAKLPLRFWRVFLMRLSSALIKVWFDEHVADTQNERRRA